MTYFYRLFIPVILSILALCAAVVVLVTPAGTPVQWETFATVFGGAAPAAFPTVVGGALRRATRGGK